MAPPKNKNRASLLDFFTKQLEEDERNNLRKGASVNPNNSHVVQSGFDDNDVITLSDSPLEMSNDTTKNKRPAFLGAASTSYSPVVSSSSAFANTNTIVGRYTSLDDLQQSGADMDELKSFHISINEPRRQFEMEAFIRCLQQNTSISLPINISANHIVALIFHNFLRIYSRSSVVYCCGSSNAAESLRDRCIAIGIPPHEVSIIDTFQAFKKMDISLLGRVIVSTPQTIQKIVDSNDTTISSRFVCIVFDLDANETANKYKKIVGSLTVKGIHFRIIVVIPSIPSTSRKTGTIAKRQQLITSLHITNWFEPNLNDPKLRSNLIPSGINVRYWDEENFSDKNKEIIDKWKQGCDILLNELNSIIQLQFTDMRLLIYSDWEKTLAKAKNISPIAYLLAQKCHFLCESLSKLILNGLRVFYFFCNDYLNNEGKVISEDIQMMILQEENLSYVFQKIQHEYSYIYDGCEINQNYSINSHIKYSILRDDIMEYNQKSAGALFGLILTSSTSTATVLSEVLSKIPSCNVLRVVAQDCVIPVNDKNNVIPINRLSGIFYSYRQLIVILPLDLPYSLNAADTAASNGLQFVAAIDRQSIVLLDNHVGDYLAYLNQSYEKLREYDGRVRIDETAFEPRRSFIGMGVVDRYDGFKFEPSSICLNVSMMNMIEYHPLISVNSSTLFTINRRQGFEFSAVDAHDYFTRLQGIPEPKGTEPRSKSFLIEDYSFETMTLSIDQLSWNEHVQYLGDIGCSTTTKRFIDTMLSEESAEKKRRKRKYHYDDRLIDKELIDKYSSIMNKLDELLLISSI